MHSNISVIKVYPGSSSHPYSALLTMTLAPYEIAYSFSAMNLCPDMSLVQFLMYGHATSCDSIVQKVCLSLTAAASQIGVSGGDALYFNPDHAHTDITNLLNFTTRIFTFLRTIIFPLQIKSWPSKKEVFSYTFLVAWCSITTL